MGYRVLKQNGEYYHFQRRSQAIDYYKMFDGKTLEFFYYDDENKPVQNMIIDHAGVDIRLIRKDEDLLNKTSIAMQNAIKKYDQNHTIQFKCKLNLETDSDIISFLESCDNKQGMIKELIRKEIANRKNNC